MKIFWSWQSDTPENTGRYFVRDALIEAVAQLKVPEDIEEPTTAANREAIHADFDREGVTGSPPLAATIKRKIKESAVFIADITPVSRVPARKDVEEKRNMNVNVAIELGYAMDALSEERVLLMLNEFYGGREFLPFHLQDLGGPITYSLAPDAGKDEIKAERAKLRGKLVVALRGFMKAKSAGEAEPAFPAIPSTTSKAVWFDPGETLAEFDAQSQYSFDDDKGVFLKILPRAAPAKPYALSALAGFVRQSQVGVLHRNQTGMPTHNRRGAIVIEPVGGNGGPLHAATQVFPNGQMWSFARMLVDNAYGKLIPVKLVEHAIGRALTLNVAFMHERLGIAPPYDIEFGAVGIRGYKLAIDTNVDNPYDIYDDELVDTFVLSDVKPTSIDAALLRIFEAFFRAAGYERPPNLFGFPPK
jgi:hypothetical protein